MVLVVYFTNKSYHYFRIGYHHTNRALRLLTWYAIGYYRGSLCKPVSCKSNHSLSQWSL